MSKTKASTPTPSASQVFLRGLINDLAEAGAGHNAEWVAAAHRFPLECRALFSACHKLYTFNVDCCNGSGMTEEEEGNMKSELRDEVCHAAGKLLGEDCTVTLQGDPRGLPVYIAWPGMSDRLRCGWTPERGMPVLYSRELITDYIDAFDYEA